MVRDTHHEGAELSAFGAEKFTTRSREVVEAAQLAATSGGNTHTEPVHLLVALLRQEDGSSRSLVQKAGVDPATLLAQAERVQQQLPRATGSTVQQPSASAALTRGLASSLDLAGSMKDDYVAGAKELLQWINEKTENLNDRTFANTLEDAEAKVESHTQQQ